MDLRRAGFSLLELLAVLAVLALLAAVAALSVRLPLSRARHELAEEKVRNADQLLRALAGRSAGPVTLIVDLDSGTLVRDGIESGRVTIGSGLPIEEVMVSGSLYQTGEARVPFRGDGSSPSYAVHWRTQKQQSRWLFVCGGSGQVESVEDASIINQLLRAPAGTHTD